MNREEADAAAARFPPLVVSVSAAGEVRLVCPVHHAIHRVGDGVFRSVRTAGQHWEMMHSTNISDCLHPAEALDGTVCSVSVGSPSASGAAALSGDGGAGQQSGLLVHGDPGSVSPHLQPTISSASRGSTSGEAPSPSVGGAAASHDLLTDGSHAERGLSASLDSDMHQGSDAANRPRGAELLSSDDCDLRDLQRWASPSFPSQHSHSDQDVSNDAPTSVPRKGSGAWLRQCRLHPIAAGHRRTVLQAAYTLVEFKQGGVSNVMLDQISQHMAVLLDEFSGSSQVHDIKVPRSLHMAKAVLGTQDAALFEFGWCSECAWRYLPDLQRPTKTKQALLAETCPRCGTSKYVVCSPPCGYLCLPPPTSVCQPGDMQDAWQ